MNDGRNDHRHAQGSSWRSNPVLWLVVGLPLLSIVAGVAFAVYVEPIVTHIFGWPKQVQGGVAFLLGLGGLVATAGAVQVWKAMPGLVLGWIERKLGR